MNVSQEEKKKTKGVFRTIWIVVAVAFAIYLLPMLYGPFMLFPLLFSGDAPPAPEIKEAEFPFVLTYELNGETKVLEDAIVCQFDGYYSRGEGGKARRWKTSLKNNNELMPYQDGCILLLNLRENQVFDGEGQRVIEVYFYAGAAGSYMGDNSQFTANLGIPQKLDYVGYVYQNEDGTVSDGSMSTEDAYLTFKLRIVSWEGSLPIDSFKAVKSGTSAVSAQTNDDAIRNFIYRFILSTTDTNSQEFASLVDDTGFFSITYFSDARDENIAFHVAKDSIRDDLVLVSSENKVGITLWGLFAPYNLDDIQGMPIHDSPELDKLSFDFDLDLNDENTLNEQLDNIILTCEQIIAVNNVYIPQLFVLSNNLYAFTESQGTGDIIGNWVLFEKTGESCYIRAIIEIE